MRKTPKSEPKSASTRIDEQALSLKRKSNHEIMGRHREFSTEEALDTALQLFWQNGYEGTSFSDLTAATGVAAPGLYAAFGNKEALFLKALDRYQSEYLAYFHESLEQPTVLGVVETFLREHVALITRSSNPPGCLAVNGALACSSDAEPVREALVARRAAGEKALSQRFKRAKREGVWMDPMSPDDMARYVMTVAEGLAVQAKAGARARQLNRVVDLALRSIA